MGDKLQGFFAGVITTALFAGGAVYAYDKQIMASYNNIKVYIDNILCEQRDAYGMKVEPFISDGTTYLPVRGIASAVGMQVEWDGASNSVYLWDRLSPGEVYMVDEIEPYDSYYGFGIYSSKKGNSFDMAGNEYSNGYTMPYNDTWGIFNLGGKYNSMTFIYGPAEEVYGDSVCSVSIIVDGNTVGSATCSADDLPRKITVPLNHGSQLKIVRNGDFSVGLADVILN